MRFEWDPVKNERNIAKHRISFMQAATLFERPHVRQPSPRVGEKRWKAIGRVEGRYVVVVYTIRGDLIRLISARRARAQEEAVYRHHLGGIQ